MKKSLYVTAFLTAICILLSGCGKYIKRDVFSFFCETERLSGVTLNADKALYSDGTYTVFPSTDDGKIFILSAETDETGVPRQATLVFDKKTGITTGEIAAVADSFVKAFTIGELENASVFDMRITDIINKTAESGYVLSTVSNEIFTVISITREYPVE